MRFDVHFDRENYLNPLSDNHTNGLTSAARKYKYIQKRNYLVLVISCILLIILSFKRYLDIFKMEATPPPPPRPAELSVMHVWQPDDISKTLEVRQDEQAMHLLDCFKTFDQFRNKISLLTPSFYAQQPILVGPRKIPLQILQKLYLTPHQDITRAGWLQEHILPFIKEERLFSSSAYQLYVIFGGAGFIGSHLVDRLLLMGESVLVVDNLSTGRLSNLVQWQNYPKFTFIEADVTDKTFMLEELLGKLHHIEALQFFHFACPASPPMYQRDPLATLNTAFSGTQNILELAVFLQNNHRRVDIVMASTSEVYGNPTVHPQKESYYGSVNALGPRSCYDEGKRVMESLAFSFTHQKRLSIKIARIFNTFGPRMQPQDGRLLSELLSRLILPQASSSQDASILVHGDGQQTRTLLYIHDLVDGLLALADFQVHRDHLRDFPVFNLGGTHELTVFQIVELVQQLYKHYKQFYLSLSPSFETFRAVPPLSPLPHVRFQAARQDDPARRKPCLDKARTLLNWSPSFCLLFGIFDMFEAYRLVESAS
jgi:UDP-glucuronate decarboxylase